MTLLFVEDEIYTRNGILHSINWPALGIDRVESAGDGRAGLERLKIKPDILLTDIRMPFLSGLELATIAKKQDANCEIIILSSHSDKEYLFTAISLSTVAYIEKPVDIDELKKAIELAVCRRKQSLRIRKLDADPVGISQVIAPLLEKADLGHSTRLMLEYLEGHYQDPDLSVDHLASIVHLSTVYVSSIFKEETGHNLKRIITDLRLMHAKEMLSRTNLSIADIALSVGYRSSNYFSKLFRKETGLTPNEYRDTQV